MTRLATALAALIALPAAALAEEARTTPVLVLSEDFESAPYLFEHPNVEPAPGEGVDGGTAARFTYVGYDRGSERIVRRVRLDERGTEYTLNYDVRFEEDFQFVGGGKLHGFGPDRSVTGGQDDRPDGWSARVNFGRGGGVRTYLYVQDRPGQWGVSRGNPDFAFEKGRYHAVSFHVRLNDVGEENGFANVYVDGERIVTHEGVAFRGTDEDSALISRFLVSTFHGGSSPEWAPVDEDGEYVNVHAHFDNITVYRGRYIRPEPGAAPPESANGDGPE